MRPLKKVVGNWKMHGSRVSAEILLQELCAGYNPAWKNEMAVLVPSVFLSLTQDILKESKISWGAQVLSEYDSGAYTGEISASMLLDFGCKYVLVGHSERRLLYGETDNVIALKFISAIKSGLTPILCVGESLKQRECGEAEYSIKQQLDAVLSSKIELAMVQPNFLIAYEPVWAIGTGLAASPEQAQAMHSVIRQHVGVYNKGLASSLQILYGGSVKASNAGNLFAMPDIDGGLIGGASLNANEFLEINKLCSSY
jgi:triosephosphate isomerase